MRGGIRGRIPLVRRTHILDDEMTPHSIDRGLAGSSKQRRRDDFDLKGRSREHLVGAGITVWYQEASARNSSVHELVTTRTQISLQCSFKHAWCVYSPPPPLSRSFQEHGGRKMDVPYMGAVSSMDSRKGLYVDFVGSGGDEPSMLITNEDDWLWGHHHSRKPRPY